MRHVYLDHQAATPVAPEVFEAMRPYLTDRFGNPGSRHQRAAGIREALETARAQVAAFVNAESSENIIFTADATESANLAVKGTAWANHKRGNHIIVSEIEHPSILKSVEFLEKHGFVCTRVKVDAQGFVDPQHIQQAITDRTILVALHWANYDIGTIQPIKAVSDITNEAGIAFYVDAGAAAGWHAIDVQTLGVSLLSFAPQTFHGPPGAGVLYRNRRAQLTPLIHGGDQENGLRAGVENYPAIIGCGAACELATRFSRQWTTQCRDLQIYLWNKLGKTISSFQLNGPAPGAMRAPNNLNISFEFVEGESVVLLADLNGISMSGATGCVTKSLKGSPVLAALGVPTDLAHGTVILSPGKENTRDEMDYAVETMAKIVKKLREMSPAWQEQKGRMT